LTLRVVGKAYVSVNKMLKVCYENMKYTCEIPVSEDDQPVSIERGIDCILVAFASDRWFVLKGDETFEVYQDLSEDGMRSMH